MARFRSSRCSARLVFGMVVAGLFASGTAAAPAAAQQRDSGITLELFGGVATYGRFLEQVATEGVGAARERELTAESDLVAGASLGFFTSLLGIDDFAVRLGFQFGKSDFKFQNDDPRQLEDFEETEAGELTNYIASATIMKFLGEGDEVVAPYGIAGVNATWWVLDEPEPGTAPLGQVLPSEDGDETLLRWGPSGGFGLQIRPLDIMSVRLEAMRHSVGNPFDGDGDDAFSVSTGTKFEEPDRVHVTRYSLGVVLMLDFD